jgi:hypothetical protein
MSSNKPKGSVMKKKTIKLSLVASLAAIAILAGCAQKSSTTNNTSNTSSGGTSTPITGGGGSGGTGGISGCNGVYREGAASCYYTNLPTITISGPGTYGVTYWSSNTNLPQHISPSQFRTDATFNVRIKPKYADATNSIQGRRCSSFTKSNFSRLQVQLMLRRSVDTLGEIRTVNASVDAYSSKAVFTVPGGTADPYILEVVSVMSNHRCNAVYGSAPGGCPNVYFDIPVNTNVANPTECVAFDIEYSTDNTYDLPN